LLAKIRARFDNVQIVSTCRPGATIAGTGRASKHASGQAIDFRVPGKKREVVRWLIANDRMGGIAHPLIVRHRKRAARNLETAWISSAFTPSCREPESLRRSCVS
jgi:hypothetical protein